MRSLPGDMTCFIKARIFVREHCYSKWNTVTLVVEFDLYIEYERCGIFPGEVGKTARDTVLCYFALGTFILYKACERISKLLHTFLVSSNKKGPEILLPIYNGQNTPLALTLTIKCWS